MAKTTRQFKSKIRKQVNNRRPHVLQNDMYLNSIVHCNLN